MMVSRELSEAIIASLIIAMGVVASALWAVGRPSRNRTALWFGLFGCLYGVRLAGASQLVQPLFAEVYWRYLDAFVNYAIIVPAGLFTESVLGPGWKLTLRRVWQGGVYAMLAMLHDVVRLEPGATMEVTSTTSTPNERGDWVCWWPMSPVMASRRRWSRRW